MPIFRLCQGQPEAVIPQFVTETDPTIILKSDQFRDVAAADAANAWVITVERCDTRYPGFPVQFNRRMHRFLVFG
jgi:hypothetical protein